MWLIWLLVFAALFIIGVVVFWIFSKIWISIKRDELKFQKEIKDVEEKVNA